MGRLEVATQENKADWPDDTPTARITEMRTISEDCLEEPEAATILVSIRTNNHKATRMIQERISDMIGNPVYLREGKAPVNHNTLPEAESVESEQHKPKESPWSPKLQAMLDRQKGRGVI